MAGDLPHTVADAVAFGQATLSHAASPASVEIRSLLALK